MLRGSCVQPYTIFPRRSILPRAADSAERRITKSGARRSAILRKSGPLIAIALEYVPPMPPPIAEFNCFSLRRSLSFRYHKEFASFLIGQDVTHFVYLKIDVLHAFFRQDLQKPVTDRHDRHAAVLIA